MARVTVEDCVEQVPNRFSLVLMAAHRARAISTGSALTLDRDNDKNPVVALREIAETLALLADPQHMHMSEQELVRALQSDRETAQEERY